ncbi:MAG TPA: hypothetical protein VGK64_03850 [Bryobacteraceae bacterium]
MSVKASEQIERVKSYHYWDFNGQLQARLNLAFGIIAVLALVVIVQGGGLFYAFRQIAHPPILKENSDGSVTVANVRVTGSVSSRIRLLPAAEIPPDEVAIKFFIRKFLNKYLSYQPATADASLADAFNMMTLNLRQASMKKMREDGEFDKIQDQRIVSNFSVIRIDTVNGVNLGYTVLGVREIHHLEDGKETSDRIVAHYNLRLAPVARTERDASGLRVAEFYEEAVMGEESKDLAQPDGLMQGAVHQQLAADAGVQ